MSFKKGRAIILSFLLLIPTSVQATVCRFELVEPWNTVHQFAAKFLPILLVLTLITGGKRFYEYYYDKDYSWFGWSVWLFLSLFVISSIVVFLILSQVQRVPQGACIGPGSGV